MVTDLEETGKSVGQDGKEEQRATTEETGGRRLHIIEDRRDNEAAARVNKRKGRLSVADSRHGCVSKDANLE